MFLDKKGKIFGKVNIIDFIALLLIIVLIIGIALRFKSIPSKNAKAKVNLSYVVELEDVRKYTVTAFEKKGTVTDEKEGCLVGEIKDVSFEPHTEEEFDADGNLIYAEVPEKYNVYVTIDSVGKESNNSYFVGNDIELSVGSTIKLATKYVNSSGKVKEIVKK